MSFLFPFLKIITILAFFKIVAIQLSDNHLLYSLASDCQLSIPVGIRSRISCGIYCVWPLGHQCFPPHLYVEFDVTHSHHVATFNLDLFDECYVCDAVWPVC